jgi:DNA polymerase-1
LDPLVAMTSANAAPTLFLVDAHALLFQVFHAIPEMSGPGGLPTNALFGFTRDMLFLRNERRPDYLICVFDPPGPTFRDKIFAEYKAHRSPMPDSMRTQIPLVYQMLAAMRIPALTQEGFEADDVLATVARAGAKRGFAVYVCTNDKDCRQLLSDRIKLFNLRKRETFDREALLKDWGITPEQVIDFQTLVGDSVDNIAGVAGIGEKTAAKLLQEFGTVDNLLANIDKVPGAKKQENLRSALPILPRTRQLVTLKTDVPLEMAWEQWRVQEWNAPELLRLFKEWGFRSFGDLVRTSTPKIAPSNGPMVQGDLFAAEQAEAVVVVRPKPADNWDYSQYALVDTADKFAALLERLEQQKRIAIDLETTGLEPRRCQLVGLACSWQEGTASYVALRGPEGEPVLDEATVLAALKPILEAPSPVKVNQNIKYDLIVLREHGIHLQGLAGDPMVAHYVLHADEREHNMEVLSRTYLHHEVIPITDLIGKRGKGQLQMDQVPPRRVAAYSGEDADLALRLSAILDKEIAGQGFGKLYEELEVPLIEVLAELEYNGIRIDVPRLTKLGAQMGEELTGIEQDIYRLAGREFNIGSLLQLRKVLFDDLQLPTRRRTGVTRQASTDQEALEELAQQGHELPRKLLEHRRIAKLKSTYVDALPKLVHPRTRRVHASFNQTVAATGRLSSSDPNLQNIPIRTEQGGQIRQAFVPEPGWVLLTADYSQIELRLLAHFCGDEVLRQAFAADHDIHATVAAQVFGVPEKDVTSDMRRAAKTVNFGVIYGISPFGLARRLEITKEEAGKFIDDYFKRYPKVLHYQDNLLRKARGQGYVATLLGRQRRFDPKAIRERSTYLMRNQAEREAINMEIQGSAADLIKVAMLNCYRRLKAERRKARMLLQIHDELVFEVPPDELADVSRLVHDEMSQALADRVQVPLKVDVEAGPNWLDTKACLV